MNTTRRETRDRNIEGLGTMIGIGKDIMGSAGQNLGEAASMAHQRREAARAASAQRKQQTISTVATLGGLGLMAAGVI